LFSKTNIKVTICFSANKNFHNVSLGQGQEVVAEEAMGVAAKSNNSYYHTIGLYSTLNAGAFGS